jgi:hypothetical protein
MLDSPDPDLGPESALILCYFRLDPGRVKYRIYALVEHTPSPFKRRHYAPDVALSGVGSS